MSLTTQMNFRIPNKLIEEMEKLVKSGRFSNKTDIILSGIRLIINQEKLIEKIK